MKTITKAEYEALPIEKRRYWNEERTVTGEDGVMIDYTPVTIYLEDAEGVIEKQINEFKKISEIEDTYAYASFAVRILTEALNKLKGV